MNNRRLLFSIVLAAVMSFPLQALAQTGGWAIVRTSAAHLRAKPDYESAMESQCLMGTVVKITGAERYWRRVDVPDYRNVWTNELVIVPLSEAGLKEYEAAPKYICTAAHSTLYSEPCADSEPVCDFILGDLVRKAPAAVRGHWCHEDCRDGGWTAVLTPDGRTAYVRSRDVEDFELWVAGRKASGDSLVAAALRFVGVPYLWGGASVGGFDCSGLVKTIYHQCGITLPRNAREQIRCGTAVEYSLEQMLPGDLLFYGSMNADGSIRSVTHVAMYIGEGRIIHSSQLVRINAIALSGAAPDGKYELYDRTPIAVRRMLGSPETGGLHYDPRYMYFQ